MNSKKCSICKDYKVLEEFYKDISKSDGYTSKCKICSKQYDNKRYISKATYLKNYYANNIEQIQLKNQIYYNNNKKEILLYHKEYNSIYEVKSRENKRKRDYYKNNPQYKLRVILKSRFYEMLKINKTGKSKNALELLGCSIHECKLYLESLFLPEMNWENHGTIWEIDHIKPCDSFNLTIIKEQEVCFHYTNLKPIFKTNEIAESFGYINYIGNRNKRNKI